MQERYITEEEREKCRKVAAAFSEVFDGEDLAVLDAGRFGFVKVQYYNPSWGFDSVSTFCEGIALFEDLWEEWFTSQLLRFAGGTPMEELEYGDIFQCMPKEMQDFYRQKKQELMEKAGFESVLTEGPL